MKDNNGWISFSDEMPPEDAKLLVYGDIVNWQNGPPYKSVAVAKQLNSSLFIEYVNMQNVTHWRRIELPEVEDEWIQTYSLLAN